MLKRSAWYGLNRIKLAATFGWLCVETRVRKRFKTYEEAATFGWLCVETIMQDIFTDFLKKAATFGWLCVETD